MERSLQDDLAIDKFKLDSECISHSGIYAYYCEKMALAKTQVSKDKDNLELVTAEANIRIRKEKSESGEKITENLISAYILLDSEVKEAKARVRESEEILAMFSVAVQSMETRRSELDNLVKLYCSQYFSVPMNYEAENSSLEIKKNLNKKHGG